MAKKKARSSAAFDKYLAVQLENDEFRATYDRSLRLQKSEQRLLAAIDRARELRNLTKSELARRTGKQLPAISRLLSPSRGRASNPRLDTVLELLEELDLRLRVEKRNDRRTDVVAVSGQL